MLDKASGPIRRIRQEAQRTDRAVKNLGQSLDQAATLQNAKNLERNAQAIRGVGTETNRAVPALGRARREMRGVDRDSNSLNTRLIKVGASIASLGRIMGLLKFPAMAAGAGLAATGVGALAGGVASLVPMLVDLSGAAAGAGPALVGLGLAFATVKLATKDIGKALGGNVRALEGLTPSARKFVVTLKQFSPVMKGLRESAQRGLFPGLDQSIRNLAKSAPMAERLLNRMGRALGNRAASFTSMLSGAGNQKMLERLGNTGVGATDQFGGALQHLAQAFIYVSDAARPMVTWFSKAVNNWAKGREEAAKTANETGRLGRFFDRTRGSMSLMADIGRNLWATLRGIGQAARPLGEHLWGGFDKVTKTWAEFTNSADGQMKMRRWFAAIRPPLDQFFGLIGDLGKAWARLTEAGSPDLANTLRGFRDTVPALERFLSGATTMGPDAARFIGEIGRTLAALPWSPVKIIVRLLTDMLTVVNTLIATIPGLGLAISGALTVAGLSRLPLIGPAMAAAGVGAGRAAARNVVAPAVEGAALGTAAKGGLAAGAGGLAVAGRGALTKAGGVFLQGARGGAYGAGALGAGRSLATSAGGAVTSGLGRAGMVASRVAPIGLGVAAVQQLSKGWGYEGASSDTASILTGGLVPNAAEQTSRGGKKGQQQIAQHFLGDPRTTKGIRANREKFKNLTGDPVSDPRYAGGIRFRRKLSDAAGSEDKGEAKARRKVLGDELRRENAIYRIAMKERQRILNAASRQNARSLTVSFGKAFDTYSRSLGPEAAMKKTNKNVLDRLGHMRPAGRKVLGQNMLAWGREMAKHNPALRGQVDRLTGQMKRRFADLGQHIEIVNGHILTGSRGEWRKIAKALSDPAQKALQEVSTAFTAIQNRAVGALQSQGYTKGQARSIVGGMDGPKGSTTVQGAAQHAGTLARQNRAHGGRVRLGAGGLRIAGVGLADTVPIAPGHLAAPGELVVNRHTERRVDHKLRREGTSLGREVGVESRPHSSPLSPQAGGAPPNARVSQGIMPGFAVGGRYAVGGRQRAARRDAGRDRGISAAGGNLQAMVSAANRIDNKHFNYVWGGGHNAAFSGPYDCSGAVSAVLHAGGALAGPLTSGALASWGAPGPGAVTVYANPGHTYMSLNGRFFGTSGANPGGGAGWFPGGPRAGFAVRHLPGAGGGGAINWGAMGAGGAGGGGQPIDLVSKVGASKVGGVPGALSNAARRSVARGLQRKINRRTATQGPGGAAGAATDRGALSRRQVMRLWVAAGGTPSMAGQMASIAFAESRFNPRAHNASGASGLWQIMTPLHNSILTGDVYDPLVNARAAVRLYGGSGLSPWAASRGAWGNQTGGRVKRYLTGDRYAPHYMTHTHAGSRPRATQRGGGLLGALKGVARTVAGAPAALAHPVRTVQRATRRGPVQRERITSGPFKGRSYKYQTASPIGRASGRLMSGLYRYGQAHPKAAANQRLKALWQGVAPMLGRSKYDMPHTAWQSNRAMNPDGGLRAGTTGGPDDVLLNEKLIPYLNQFPGSAGAYWGAGTPLHEWAHTQQRTKGYTGNAGDSLDQLIEGGAEAFARAAEPRVMGGRPAGWKEGKMKPIYERGLDRLRGHEDFVMRGQFPHLAGRGYEGGMKRAMQWGGWHKRGGSFVARRPTLIGVGEGGGHEAVNVRRVPAGRGGGGRQVRLAVNIAKIENHRSGDVKEHVKREMESAFNEFAREHELQLAVDGETF